MNFWRVWAGCSHVGRCSRCRRKVLWAITDAGKNIPIDLGEKPLRRDRDTKGRQFDIYAGSAYHGLTCAQKKPPARRHS